MNLPDHEVLRRLGAGNSIDSVCTDAGLTADAFTSWWRDVLRARLPSTTGTRRCGVRQSVTIRRDDWGIPHIHAANDADLFFGFGYAMAQDRLWQLDFFRRKGAGRLAEICGPRGHQLDFLLRMVGVPSVLEWDLLARTVGIRRIAAQEWPRLGSETQGFLQAFADGVNAHIDEMGDRLPIEFSLLDYRPEPWTPLDCLTIEGDFRWYLTGRFPIIVIPELARRGLGAGPLYQAYLQAESDEESILHPGDYARTGPRESRSSRWVQPSARPGRRAAAIIGWCPAGWPRGASPCWPAILTCRSTRCRGGTRFTCAAGRFTWPAWRMPGSRR